MARDITKRSDQNLAISKHHKDQTPATSHWLPLCIELRLAGLNVQLAFQPHLLDKHGVELLPNRSP